MCAIVRMRACVRVACVRACVRCKVYLRGGIAETRSERCHDSGLAPSKRPEGSERLLGSAAALRSPFGARDGSFAQIVPRPRNIRRLVQVDPAKQPRRPVDPRRIGRHEAVRPRAAVDAGRPRELPLLVVPQTAGQMAGAWV